jgi:predicted adenine nucleotide alpha hydrolase (AANH) superfamily ATPase
MSKKNCSKNLNNPDKLYKLKMLMHVCCANCAIHPLNILKDKFDITMYFYNPNIHPEEEYQKRLSNAEKVSRITKIPLITGNYIHDLKKWFKLTEKLKDLPEGQERCNKCFKIRLEKTALFAKKNGFDIFTTTLTISPHKNQQTINAIGNEISQKFDISFFIADFKKQDGFKKTMQLAKELKIYRQNYCGCLYSIRK